METKEDYSQWAVPCLVKHFFQKIPRHELYSVSRETVAYRIARHHGKGLDDRTNGTLMAYWVKHLLHYFPTTKHPSVPLCTLMDELQKRMTEYEEVHGEVVF